MALGFHHVCTIDTNASLQCDGHNSAGQADAGRQPRPRRLPGDTRHAPPATEEEAADGYGGGHEEYAPLPPDGFAYAEVRAGEYHTLGLTLSLTVTVTLTLSLTLTLTRCPAWATPRTCASRWKASTRRAAGVPPIYPLSAACVWPESV